MRERSPMARAVLAAVALVMAALVMAACSSGHGGVTAGGLGPAGGSEPGAPGPDAGGLGKIRHVVVIMQENRSFDSYFGTFPGAEGIPMRDGVPTVCSPDPSTRECQRPYHDPADVNGGGPHGAPAATADIAGAR